MLGISRQHLYDIINGKKAVSADMAAKLGKLVGGGASLWLRAQAEHDAWNADRSVDVSGIPSLVDA
jgi:addiction module HigA family antidote